MLQPGTLAAGLAGAGCVRDGSCLWQRDRGAGRGEVAAGTCMLAAYSCSADRAWCARRAIPATGLRWVYRPCSTGSCLMIVCENIACTYNNAKPILARCCSPQACRRRCCGRWRSQRCVTTLLSWGPPRSTARRSHRLGRCRPWRSPAPSRTECSGLWQAWRLPVMAGLWIVVCVVMGAYDGAELRFSSCRRGS